MKLDPGSIHLALFLSRATPLARWQARGIYAREIALYKTLAQRLGRVSLVTSGGPGELDFQADLGEIEILHNRWGLSPNLYSLLAPVLHHKSLSRASVFKTNQLDGAWTAILAGKLHRKPVVVRAGYLWVENFRRTDRGVKSGLASSLIEKAEAFSVRRADALLVTTAALGDFLARKYALAPGKIEISPNYVDVELFRPLENLPKVPGRVCFVGRLSVEKNLPLLIEAVSGLPGISLQLIGEGPGRDDLQKLAASRNSTASFPGVMQNPRLPEQLNQAEAFVLPSQFEGHPKALIEAMSCGTAVIGTDVEGIREVIRHRETGLLCPPTVEGLRAAILELHADPRLRRDLGANARRFALENFALKRIVDQEVGIYQRVIEKTCQVFG